MSESLKREKLPMDAGPTGDGLQDQSGKKPAGMDRSLGKIKSDLLIAQSEAVQQQKHIQALISDLDHLANENTLRHTTHGSAGWGEDTTAIAGAYERKMAEFINLYQACWDDKCRESRLKSEALHRVERMEHHLSYQIGQAIVQTYKNYPPIVRWCKLPLAISKAKLNYRSYRAKDKAGDLYRQNEQHAAQAYLSRTMPSVYMPVGVKSRQFIVYTGGYEQPVYLMASVVTAQAHDVVDIEVSNSGDRGNEGRKIKLQGGKTSILVAGIETSSVLPLAVKADSKIPTLLKLEIVKDPDSKEMEMQEAYFTMANQHIVDDAEWLQAVNAYLSSIGALPVSLRSGTGPRFSRLWAHVPAENTVQDGPKVSVIMTAYNVEDFVETAIRSILAQTWRNIELIVVDDNSGDSTPDIVRRVMEEDDRVRLICNEVNSGTYIGRNAAYQVASGEYVTCHDSDDWAHPERIQRQISALMADPSKIASMSGCIRMVEDGHFLLSGEMSPQNNSSSLMFKKDIVQPVLGYWDSVRVAADSEYRRRIKLAFGNECIANMAEIMMLCAARPQSLTQNPVYGIYSNGSLSAARFCYQSLYKTWHAELEGSKNFYLPFPLTDRPFAAPRSILPEADSRAPEGADESISHADIKVEEINDSLQGIAEMVISFNGDVLIEGDVLLDSGLAYNKGRIVIAKNGHQDIIYDKKIAPKTAGIRIGGIIKGCVAGDRLHIMFIPASPKAMLHVVKATFTAGLLPENRTAPILHDQSRTAALATYPGRINVLPDVIDSLLPQVDALFIYLNNYTTVPHVIKNHPQRHKIYYVIDTTSAKRAAAKFFWTGAVQGYHIICDDDILYPYDYVETMVRKIDAYDRQAMVGVHGTCYNRHVEDFRTSRSMMYHYEQPLAEDTPVHALGTGTIAFHSSLVRDVDFGDMLKFPVSTDQVLACLARNRKIPLVCIQRHEGWMQSNPNMLFGIFAEKSADKVLRQATSDIVKKCNPWPQALKLPAGKRRSFLAWLKRSRTV